MNSDELFDYQELTTNAQLQYEWNINQQAKNGNGYYSEDINNI